MNPLKLITIKRIAMNLDSTLGVMLEEGTNPFCLTMELPWKDNQRDVSCIPEGEYMCSRTVTSNHGECFRVLNVLNRDHILIHKGNFSTDSQGCIIVGEQFEDILSAKADKVVTAVLASGKAYSELMLRLNRRDSFKLIIQKA